MLFKKQDQLHPKQTTKNTQYRFTEIELQKAIQILSRFTLNQDQTTATKQLIQAIAPYHSKDTHQQLLEAFSSYSFQNPTQEELVHYFRYLNLGVKKVRKYTGASQRDLVHGGKYDTIPELTPVFPYWKDLEPCIFSWNNYLKEKLNLFDDTVIHAEIKIQKDSSRSSSNEEKPEEEEEELTELEKMIKAEQDYFNTFN